MDFPNDEFRRAHTGQLRHFDQQLVEVRRVYDSLTGEERADLRKWLQEVDAVWEKCPFDWTLIVKMEHDECDDDGEKIDERNAEFTPMTYLKAIEAWDKGEPFVPNTVYP